MPIHDHLETYQESIAQTEQTIEGKRLQLSAATDPLVKDTLRKTLTTLEELLVIYQGTAEALFAIRQSTRI